MPSARRVIQPYTSSSVIAFMATSLCSLHFAVCYLDNSEMTMSGFHISYLYQRVCVSIVVNPIESCNVALVTTCNFCTSVSTSVLVPLYHFAAGFVVPVIHINTWHTCAISVQCSVSLSPELAGSPFPSAGKVGLLYFRTLCVYCSSTAAVCIPLLLNRTS
jgi:hypothetical protein